MANSNTGARPAPLLAAGMMLAERGIYGMIWVDDLLNVSARHGKLVSFVEIGEPLVKELVPLVGLENEIRALKADKGSLIDMPGVSIVGADGATPKVNISVYWSDEEQCFLVVLTRFSARSDLEVELSRQIRARLIAEAEVTHKSNELARANAELARANRDLEEFAAIISHDLKSPMRGLRYMAEGLEADIAAGSTSVRSKLAEMVTLSQRMSAMLSSLLEYSSAGRKEEVAELIDTDALVNAIVRTVTKPSGIEVAVQGVWPVLTTLGAPLDLVLRNLLDNAIKHHDRAAGRVTLACADAGDGLEITVSDDGPGIAPELHEAVFLPFRRLAPSETREGQGMGLAFVKRWVEAAGGRISIQSDPAAGRGTTFRLHWPRLGRV